MKLEAGYERIFRPKSDHFSSDNELGCRPTDRLTRQRQQPTGCMIAHGVPFTFISSAGAG